VSDHETIRYQVEDDTAMITLARPDKRNAMNAQMFEELADAAEAARADPDVRCVLVAAEGPSFCAGIDLALLSDLAGVHGTRFASFVRMAQRPFRTLAGMEKPTVAAVQGHAIGAGCQLALACDLRVVAEDVSFAILELRYGLIPDLGGAYRLARLVGPARAKELVWSGRAVEAPEAERTGLANRVASSPDTVSSVAAALLRDVTAHSPIATGLAKSLIDRAHETPFETELEREGHAQAICINSEDQREAVAAFLERRPPRFHGR
jgi:enoyl-CoA hydratase/carnithine racemase